MFYWRNIWKSFKNNTKIHHIFEILWKQQENSSINVFFSFKQFSKNINILKQFSETLKQNTE